MHFTCSAYSGCPDDTLKRGADASSLPHSGYDTLTVTGASGVIRTSPAARTASDADEEYARTSPGAPRSIPPK